jgi:hypothetical protein
MAARRQARTAPALIDDDTPTPPHARFSAARLAGRGGRRGAGLAAWLLLAAYRASGDAGADGLVLHQGRAADLRRRLCRAALCRTRARSSITAGSARRR